MQAAADRAAGVLLHPTSLPSDFGIGDLGPAASAWLEWLAEARCGLWQVLPLGPTGYADSPYQSPSAMAGNPLLISPDLLLELGLLKPGELRRARVASRNRVEYAAVIPTKRRLLTMAARRFRSRASAALAAEHCDFEAQHAHWLQDYTLYAAIKTAQGGAPWTDWPGPLACRERAALTRAAEIYRDSIEQQSILQFLFFRQWAGLRAQAGERGIRILGDVPIFVAHDSADVWARPDLYLLDGSGHPTVVAGVPPDYFSATGQLWGNPIYRWEAHRDEGYQWWIQRLRHTLDQVDVVRLDHFRGFEAAWHVPAQSPTAERGKWVEGPGAGFFEALCDALGSLPIFAEDLGVITPAVHRLRESFALPGMQVFQFAFTDEAQDEEVPADDDPRNVAYTGTHDNDTSLGWYRAASRAERSQFEAQLCRPAEDPPWDMIDLVWASACNWVLAPMQDMLSLGSEARMNYPGRAEGNWAWKLRHGQLSAGLARRLRELNLEHRRASPELHPMADR